MNSNKALKDKLMRNKIKLQHNNYRRKFKVHLKNLIFKLIFLINNKKITNKIKNKKIN